MKGSTVSLIAGALALLAGMIALVFPLPASLAVTVFVGASFLVSGAFGLFGAFSDSSLPQRGWIALFAALQLVLGVWILANPLAGLISLTLMAGALFLISGIGRIVLGFRMQGTGAFWLLVLTGLLSLGLGIYALFFPLASSPVLLGTLLAVELISVGAALIALGLTLRNRH
jgi:uncharacterized membrane protein HdeD (DUF308 family)